MPVKYKYNLLNLFSALLMAMYEVGPILEENACAYELGRRSLHTTSHDGHQKLILESAGKKSPEPQDQRFHLSCKVMEKNIC